MRLPTIQAVDAPAIALATKADLVAPPTSIFGPEIAVSCAVVAAGVKTEYQHQHPPRSVAHFAVVEPLAGDRHRQA